MTHVDVTSVEKAEIVARAAKELLGLNIDCTRGSIVERLGEASVCLCIMDAVDFELVLSHALAASQLDIETLFTFKQSEKIPGLTCDVQGRKDPKPLSKSVLEDVAQLGHALALAGEIDDGDCLHMRSLLGIGADKA